MFELATGIWLCFLLLYAVLLSRGHGSIPVIWVLLRREHQLEVEWVDRHFALIELGVQAQQQFLL